jgi:hypothetical protein
MTFDSNDQPPKMRSLVLGNDSDATTQILIEMPEVSLDRLKPADRQLAIVALSRFAQALAGEVGDDEGTLVDDLNTIAGVEGMQITLTGGEKTLTIREFMGELVVSGHPEDVAKYQTPIELN